MRHRHDLEGQTWGPGLHAILPCGSNRVHICTSPCSEGLPVARTLASGPLDLKTLAVLYLGRCSGIVGSPQLHDADLPVPLLPDELVDLVVQVSYPAQGRVHGPLLDANTPDGVCLTLLMLCA